MTEYTEDLLDEFSKMMGWTTRAFNYDEESASDDAWFNLREAADQNNLACCGIRATDGDMSSFQIVLSGTEEELNALEEVLVPKGERWEVPKGLHQAVLRRRAYETAKASEKGETSLNISHHYGEGLPINRIGLPARDSEDIIKYES